MALTSYFHRLTILELVVLTLVSSSVSDVPRTVLMRKCCPLGQQISKTLGCISVDESAASENTTEETVETLRTEHLEADFPPWMDSNGTLYSSTNVSEPVGSFLAHQPGNLVVEYGAYPSCQREHLKFFNTKNNKTRLFTNGTLIAQPDFSSDSEPEFVTFQPEEYCTDKLAPNLFLYLTCPCDKILCINKCCNQKQILGLDEKRKSIDGACVTSTLSWKPRIFQPNNTNITVAHSYILLCPNKPTCKEDYSPVLINKEKPPYEKFWIFPNGSILIENFGHGVPFGRDDYCGDRSPGEDGGVVENIYVCHKNAETEAVTTTGLLYATLHLVGSFFFLLTLVFYALLPDLRSTYQGKAFMCHAASLLVGSVFIAWTQLERRVSDNVCYTTAFVIQYSYLAAFFWLNALCVDASLRLRTTFPPPIVPSGNRKFLYFSLYAWGCPAIISIVTAVLEFAEGLPDDLLRPDFGIEFCWFVNTEATFAYFYGPIGVLLLINTLLFLFTIYNIAIQQQDSSVLRENALFNKRKEKFILHLRLFCLMGITWIMELVSFFVGGDDAYWYFTDAINMLRGLIVFLLFCCKPKVWRRLGARLRGKKKDGADFGSRITNQTTLQTSTVRLGGASPALQRFKSGISEISSESLVEYGRS